MMIRKILVTLGVIVSSSLQAVDKPKFNKEEVELLKANVTSEQHVSLEAGVFDARSRVESLNPGHGGTSINLGFNYQSFSLMKMNDAVTPADYIEYSLAELGIVADGYSLNLITAFVSEDDSLLTLLVQEPGSNYQYHINAYFYTIDADLGLTHVATQNDVVSYGYNLRTALNQGNTLLAIETSNTTTQVFQVDQDNHQLVEMYGSTTLPDTRYAERMIFNQDGTQLIKGYTTYNSTNSCVQTYLLNSDSSITKADSASCGNTYSFYTNTILYDHVDGQVLLSDGGDIAIFSVDGQGNLTEIVTGTSNNLFSVYNIYPKSFEGSVLSFSNYWGGMFYQYSMDQSGQFSQISSHNFGALFPFQGSFQGVNYLGNNVYAGYSNRWEHGLLRLDDNSQVAESAYFAAEDGLFVNYSNGDVLAINDEYFIRAVQNNVHLVKGTNHKEFEILDSVQSGFLNSYSYSTIKLDDNKVMYLGNSQYVVVSFDTATESLSIVSEGSFVDNNGNGVYFTSSNGNTIQATMVGDNVLMGVNYPDRVSVFDLNDQYQFVFREFYVDGVNGFEGVYGAQFIVADEDKIALLDPNEERWYSYQWSDSGLTMMSNGDLPMSNIQDVIKVGNKFYITKYQSVSAYQFNGGEFEWVSTSQTRDTWTKNNVAVLDENHILHFQSGMVNAYLSDSVTGGAHRVGTYDAQDLGSYLSFGYRTYVSFNDGGLWISDNSTYAIARLDLNRAPYFRDTMELAMGVNEGDTSPIELTDWILDHDGHEMTFESNDLFAAMTLDNATGTIEYSGEEISGGTATFVVTDELGLATSFEFEFTYNSAPSLSDANTIIEVNQYATNAVDLVALFTDLEGDAIFVSGEGVSQGGVLTQSFVQAGVQTLNVTVSDLRGAQKDLALAINVNGAPTASSTSYTYQAGEAISLNLEEIFSDPEGDAMSFTVAGIPSGLSLSGTSLSGSITEAGQYTFTVTGIDAKGAENITQITIKVNSAPSDSGGGAMFWLLPLLLLVRRVR